ncbi:MAG: hypothetical protein U0103_18575 [Candidatus Obscuribacterales bacterium]
MSTAELDVEPQPESTDHLPSNPQQEPSPNCLAQADVKTPWLDINAHFQLRSHARPDKPKADKDDKNVASMPFFGLPRFRKKRVADANSDAVKSRSSATAKSTNTPETKRGIAQGQNSEFQDRQESGNKTNSKRGCIGPDSDKEEGSDSTENLNTDNDDDGITASYRDGDANSDRNASTGDAKHVQMDDWHDLTVPAKRQIWQGWEGITVTTFGIALPAVVLAMSAMSMPKRLTLVMLNHPLETIAELLLLISIPVANYIVWDAICNNNMRYSLRRGMSMGAAIMSCLMTAGICVAGLFADNSALIDEIGDSFSVGFFGLASISLISGSVCAYLVNRIRLARDFKKSRAQVLAFTAMGAILALVTVIGAEFRPWSIRLAEKKSASKSPVERQLGLIQLRALEPERELLMECSDQKAAGIAGLFIPLKSSTQHELYFALTGKPYSFKDIANTDLSSMPDDYLSRHVVGERIPGLGMSRSYMSGMVHPNTLSSTIEWTYVFKNDSKLKEQEARAEIGLPPGAVITGLKLWKQGEPMEAKFVPSGKAEGSDGFAEVGHDSPAIVTDLGHSRALLHCYPVEQNEELKLQITMIVPLQADGERTASLSLPKFLATNFDLNGDHMLKLRSSNNLSSTVKNLLPASSPGGLRAISGTLSPQQLENSSLLLTAERPVETAPVAVLDKIAVKLEQQDIKLKEAKARKNAARNHQQEQVVVMIDGSKGIQSQFESLRKVMAMKVGGKSVNGRIVKGKFKAVPAKYVVETVVQTAAPAPKELVIVVDGSATMKTHIKELTRALKLLPQGIPTHVIVASQEHPELLKPTSLKDAWAKLETMQFEGGQDNLQAVVRASELAGETKGGAVLWAHGPLPVLNEEIYIMPSYVAVPSFYELPLGSGETDTYDFFKNHTEIGPFTQVPRNTTEVVSDLGAFFSKWKLDQSGYAVTLSQTTAKPEASVTGSPDEQRELLLLHAHKQISEYLTTRHITKASRIAVAYGLVSPVSCAIVQDNNIDNADNAEIPNDVFNTDEAQADKDDFKSENAGTQNGNNAAESGPNSESGGDSTPNLDTDQTSQSDNEDSTSTKGAIIQGATNGTIGETTYVTGVNTAGNVRVNNLANLEAMLNIFANLLEVGCGLIGVVIVLHSLANKSFALELMGRELEISQGQRIAVGIALLLFGLTFPGLLNWFVASARDANLFS